jgi:hypothetical protein
MIEIMVDAATPAIPAVMRLRARYRGNRAAYAADKYRRNRQMRLFNRPSMGDRMDNAGQKRWWNSMSEAEQTMTKAETKAYEQSRARAKHQAENSKPYRGSRTEASHRGFFGGKR